jgi:large subunit ribosomal protein L15
LIRRNQTVKVLGRGELTTKVDLTVNAVSASAKEAVEKAGGSVNLV